LSTEFLPIKTRKTGQILTYIRWLVVLVFCLSSLVPVKSVLAQTPSPLTNKASAKTMLAKMTPEEKVGQLFLITFKGTDIAAASQISDLIVKRHIGGVMLSAANGNFPASESLTADTFQLIQSLQKMRIDAASRNSNLDLIPLFVGISQEGDLFPNDQILTGLSAMPDAMSIGATWKPELARSVGSVYGDELRRLGFNLYMGPSLDVLDSVPGTRSEDLGVRSFGGDPFWVGEMGKEFIAGLHAGSDGRMVVISKHFPGRGGSDRPADEEVATVRKSLEQLKQIELAPFFSATNIKNTPDSITDGLSVSHIRYQGFQGNIRATTKPVSFDATALSQLMALPEIQPWREAGGLLVSDDLGSQAIRKFFDPTGVSFDGRQIARNALLAGNDLLYVNNFISSGDADEYETLTKTLDFFTQKYREDPAFAQRVNASVERILSLKYKLYPQFDDQTILLPQESLSHLGEYEEVAFDVAQQAVTLISPSQADLATVLARPPEMKERIVFITDVVSGTQCQKCPEQVTIAVDSMQKAVLRLYGPQAGGQVSGGRMVSYSFAELEQMLNGVAEAESLATSIRDADWIVLSFQKISADRPVSLAMKRLLSERQDLVRNKKVVAFAFNAPYYLDSTDISKLTAYYALYSKIPSFVDAAARVLFQEIPAAGILPVSVPGVGYDLIKVTTPDSTQIISLSLDLPETVPATGGLKPATIFPTQIPLFNVGDNLPLKAGIIQDINHNPVPDGTVAKFIFTLGNENSIIQQVETVTKGGYARTSFRIQNSGLLEVRVISEPALTSQILRLDVSGSGGAQVTAIAPTLIPTNTVVPEPTVNPTLTPIPIPSVSVNEIRARSFGGWLAGLMVLIGLIVMFYQIGAHRISVRWGVRLALLTALAGSFGLVIYGLTPIGKPLPEIWNALIFGGAGGLIGGGLGWIWYSYPRWLAGKTD
jgi:beta-N-acetylhexosaminidase